MNLKQKYYSYIVGRNDPVRCEIRRVPMVEVQVLDPESEGMAVKIVQSILKLKGYKGSDNKVLKITGSFDDNTLYALDCFKYDSCINEPMIVGIKTWSKLIN